METLTSAAGCDSVVTINLTFNDALTGEELYDGCQDDGYSVVVGGTTYDQNNPTGSETLTSAAGCDSIVTISLSFNDVLTADELYDGCQGDGYFVVVGANTYNEANPTGTETLTSSAGCDSIITINLTYNAASTGNEDYTGCQGDGYSIDVGGTTYDETNPIGAETLTNAAGCDSVVVVNLVYNSASTGDELYDGCFGDGYSVVVGGNTYDEANPIGTEVITNAAGCDSTVTVNLTFSNSVAGDELYDGCFGDGYSVVVGGTTYDETNPTGTETLTSSAGCDSIVTIVLNFDDVLNGAEIYDGCQGDGYSVVVGGNTYDETNPTGIETLTSSVGCDSIVAINLNFNASTAGEELYTGCQGDGYATVVNGNVYNEANPTGMETLTSIAGCDSVVTINLTFNDVLTGDELYDGCQDDGYSVVVGGTTYDQNNPTGSETLTSAAGCDSIVTISLSFNDVLTADELYDGCQGDGYAVIVGSNTYDEANPTGTETLTSINGCDSIITINLTYNAASTGNEDYTGCQGDGYSITVGSTTYDETNPIGAETLTNAAGCDSVVVVNLVYNTASTGDELYDGCFGDGYSVVVGGNTYDEANPIGTEVITNAAGCDSTVTVNLTFSNSVAGDELYDGCFGDGYSVVVGGNIYDETNPTGVETLTSSAGCDSIVTIALNFDDVLNGAEVYDGCQGDGYAVTVGGNIYDETNPTGMETLTSSVGCDSIVAINLNFNASTAGEELYTGCQGDGYATVVNGNVYNEANPTGTETLTSVAGCDSVVTINLTFNDALTGDELYDGCQDDGYSVVVGGTTYDQNNPTGSETLTSAAGCDSIVTISLSFNDVLTADELYDGCQGDGYSVTVGSNTYNEANPTGTETLTSINGCDSIITINLTYNATSTGNEDYTGCQGDGYSITVGSTTYDETNPIGAETLTNAAGCDSVVVVNLIYNTPSTGDELYDGCFGDGYSVTVGGTTYDEANPAGTEVITNTAGCDSTVTINLTFSNSVSGEELYDGCFGDGYSVVVGGNIYDETNPTGVETLTNAAGCDSIVTIALNFDDVLNGAEIYDGCQGDGYAVTVGGNIYDETNPTGMETLTSSVGCDSIVAVNLNFNASTSGEELYTGCQGDGYATVVNGNVYNETNPTGTETLNSAAGCDSVVTINLTFNDALTGDELYDGCQDDGYSVVVGGTTYDQNNPTGSETLTSAAGCDSIVTISLSFSDVLTADELYDGCQGDGYFVVVGANTYDEANPTGTETLTSSAGCDSIITINLTYNAASTGNEDYTGCQGDGYSITVGSTTYDETNPIGAETLTNAAGCDSVVVVNLVYNSASTGDELYDGCFGDGYSIVVGGTTYDEANPTGTEVITNAAGCDSTVTVNLTFSNSVAGDELYDGCFGDGYSVVVGGNTYDETNPTGTETLTSSAGCDSIVTINLTFNSTLSGDELYDGCQGDGYTVVVGGNTYDETNPTGSETLTSSIGCDSIVTIDLTFNAATTGDELYTGCQGDGYATVVNGNVYNETNPTGTETLTSVAGCDSVVTINLIFNDALTGDELYDGCQDDGYSVVVGGTTYDQNNPTGSETLTSAAGCDSIVTISLSFNDVLTADELYDGCQGDGYFVVVGANTYDEANPTGTETLTSSAGCDSIITINLTYNTASTGNEDYTGCQGDGYSITVGSTTYDETNPIGAETLTNAAGCDSVVVVNLVYNSASSGDELYDGCFGDGYSVVVGGNTYDEANPTGTEVITNAAGCDSTVTVNLTFSNSVAGDELYDGCFGDGYSVVVGGTTYDETNPTGTETLTSSSGCDSIVTIALNFDDVLNGAEIYDGCQGDGYAVTVGGNIYDETNPTGMETLTSSVGCDSIVAINLNFNASTSGEELYTGCQGDGYATVVNGNVYNEANPTGMETLTSVAGCDSVVTINLTFNDALTGDELYDGCQDDGYSVVVGGTTYDQNNPTGSETLTSTAGCDSIVTISLSFNDVLTADELYDGCQGDGYSVTVGSSTYDEANPTGTVTLTSVNGCDSIITINLTYNAASTGNEDYIGCQGDGYSITVGSTTYDEANPIGAETLTNAAGCDSVVVVNLVYNSASSGDELYDGCFGDGYSVVVGGNTYDEANPTGTEVITNAAGCDSTVTVNLTFSNSVAGDELYDGCFGDGYSVVVGGNTYDETNPTGTETLTSSSGCDSIVTIALNFDDVLNGAEVYDGCQGDGYAVTVGGNIYDETNPTGMETLTSSVGCDSIVAVNLNFNASTSGEELYTGCQGDGYATVVNGNVYNETNPTGMETLTGSTGCDSIVTINLTYNDALAGEELYDGCQGDGYSVIVGGTTYDEANPTGTEALTSTAGCDSIVSINLAFNDVLTGEELYDGCLGDGYSVDVGGTIYDENNPTGSETLTSTAGCDSIVSVNLEFNDVLTGEELYDGCLGDGYSVNVGGTIYDETNPTGTETLTSSAGCDSIVSVNLAFNDVLTGEELYDGCLGDGYSVNVGGTIYDENNPTGSETLTSTAGCDSIVSVNLAFNDVLTGEELYDGCIGDGYSVDVGGTIYDENNPTGSETLTSTAGCDSIVSVNLAFNDVLTGEELYDGCLGDGYSVNVGGTIYDENNPTGSETLTSTTGCDSIVSVNLAFNDVLTGEELYDGCQGDGYSVAVGGTTYDEANPTGTETLISTAGCDSIVSINLAFSDVLTGEELYDGCQGDGYSVVVGGTTYDEANPTGTETLISSIGCDSIVSVNLLFDQSASGTESYIGCEGDGYSVVVGGTTYDETNPTGTESLISSAGCDSIVTINLSFNNILAGEELYSGCEGDGYSVVVGGNTYDESNPTGMETLTSTAGCDSIVTVSLSFSGVLSGEESYSGCQGDGYSVVVGGNTYDETNPTGMETLVSVAGCDSIVTISLSFDQTAFGNEDYTGCEGDGYSIVVGGNMYDESNPMGTETLTSSAGCDSVVSVNLVYHSTSSGTELYDGCEGDGYSVVVNGIVYDEANPTGTEVIVGGNYLGCDSTVTVSLAFIPSSQNAINTILCESESVLVNGNEYDIDNPSGTEIIENGSYTGCDSIVTIDLQFTDAIEYDTTATLCEDEQIVINGNVYDFGNPSGTEIIPGGSVGGCDSIINVNLNFYPQVLASISADGVVCSGDSVEVVFLLEGGSSYDVDFFDGSSIISLMNIVNGYTIMVAPGATTTYSISNVSALGIPCDPILQAAEVTVSVNDIGVDALVTSDYDGFGVSCNDGNDGTASATGFDGTEPYNYEWSNGSTGSDVSNLSEGTYTVTATDANGCTSVDEIVISAPNALQLSGFGMPPTCFEENDGSIMIDEIMGGTAPYLVSVDGELFQTVGQLPHTIPFLEAGNYEVVIQDANDCIGVTSVVVSAPLPLLVDLGPDESILLGDSIELTALTNRPIVDFTWTSGGDQLSCDTCLQSYTRPFQTTEYTLEVVDEDGCVGFDDIVITVEKPRPVFIPNAFSPNGDGNNDVFYIFSDQEVTQIRTMRIFDRWGEVVFRQDNFQPNDPGFGWDGNLRGEPMNPAVFVYYIEVEFIDGWVESYSGDITLLR